MGLLIFETRPIFSAVSTTYFICLLLELTLQCVQYGPTINIKPWASFSRPVCSDGTSSEAFTCNICLQPAPWTTDRMALAFHVARATQRASLLRAIPARVNARHGQRIIRRNMSSSSGGHAGPKSSNDLPWIVSISTLF